MSTRTKSPNNIRAAWQQDINEITNTRSFMATVTAYTAGQSVITIERYPGATAETQPKLRAYNNPQVGDVVWVVGVGSGWLVVGSVGGVQSFEATVTAVSGSTVTFVLNGSDTTATALASYLSPAVGDTVWVVAVGSSWLAVGRTGTQNQAFSTTLTAVSGRTLSFKIGTVTYTASTLVSYASPAVGDTVWIVPDGTGWLVLGKIG